MMVQGMPMENYGKLDNAPEVFGPEPYDPFKVDVYQFGHLPWRKFRQFDQCLPGWSAWLAHLTFGAFR